MTVSFSTSVINITTAEDARYTFTATATDANGDTLTYTASNPPNGSVSILSGSVNSGVPVTVNYTPRADFNGSDSFVLTVSDGKGGTAQQTVNVTVTPVNDRPVLSVSSTSATITGGKATSFTLSATDIDKDPLTYSISAVAANGTASLAGNIVTYTPKSGYYGSDQFTVSVSDGKGGTASKQISVNMPAPPPVNIDPVFTTSTQTITTAEDARLAFTVAATDANGDTLTYTRHTPAKSGSVVVSSGSLASGAPATVTYTPDANFNGADSFVILVSDGKGGFAQQTVNVTVTPVNDRPVLSVSSTSATITDGKATRFTLSATDIDKDPLTYSISAVAANGTASLAGNIVTYTPKSGYYGADKFTVSVSDGKGGTASQQISVNMPSPNIAPVFTISQSLDVGIATTRSTLSGAGGDVTFTDDASKNSYVRIDNFTSGDKIRIVGASEAQYVFASGDYDSDGVADDLSIRYENKALGVVNDIQILNVLSSSGVVIDKASAISAVGFNFISFG